MVPAKTLDQAKAHSMVALASHCAYVLATKPGTRFDSIERIHREMAQAVNANRARAGFEPGSLRFIERPTFAIEIDTPMKTRLDLPGRHGLQPMTGLIGRSFSLDGAKNEVLDITQHHHALVAALSGHGKSVVMRAALSTMLYNTSPDDLKLLVVDLKNDDLLPFRDAPHTIQYAGDLQAAIELVRFATEIKQQRVAEEGNVYPYRLLIVIDELAEMNDGINEAKPSSMRHQLASLMKTGRSMEINTLMATQYPSAKEIGTSVARAFTHRIVGRVDSAPAASFVSGRSKTGAEMLRKSGAFLRVDRGDVIRMQSYYSERDDTVNRVRSIVGKWGKRESIPAWPVEVADDDVSISDDEADEFELLADLIAEYKDESGGMRRGFMTRAVTALNGGKTPTGTVFSNLQRRVSKYVEYAQ